MKFPVQLRLCINKIRKSFPRKLLYFPMNISLQCFRVFLNWENFRLYETLFEQNALFKSRSCLTALITSFFIDLFSLHLTRHYKFLYIVTQLKFGICFRFWLIVAQQVDLKDKWKQWQSGLKWLNLVRGIFNCGEFLPIITFLKSFNRSRPNLDLVNRVKAHSSWTPPQEKTIIFKKHSMANWEMNQLCSTFLIKLKTS